ncbi:MAG: creatininase [Raoultibacter sp.]
MESTVYMEDLDAFTYRKKLTEENPIVFVPVGAFEQHGPHMPMCVDAALTKAMAGAVAEKIDGLVAAPIVYGYKSQQRSGGGFHLTGTTSMSGSTLISIVKDITCELAYHGVHKIVFMNGHFENYQFIFEGVDKALRELRGAGKEDVKVMLMSYWDFIDDETIERLYPEGFTGWDLEHAGVMETSLMLLFQPEKVHMDKVVVEPPAVMPNYDILPINPDYTPASGCLSCAVTATREKGEILRDVSVKNMVEAVSHEF